MWMIHTLQVYLLTTFAELGRIRQIPRRPAALFALIEWHLIIMPVRAVTVFIDSSSESPAWWWSSSGSYAWEFPTSGVNSETASRISLSLEFRLASDRFLDLERLCEGEEWGRDDEIEISLKLCCCPGGQLRWCITFSSSDSVVVLRGGRRLMSPRRSP